MICSGLHCKCMNLDKQCPNTHFSDCADHNSALNKPEVVVLQWISAAEAEAKEQAVGGMGGFFNAGLIHPNQKDQVGMRWKDYVENFVPEVRPYLEAIRKDVLEKDLRFSGEQHQYSADGTPLFSDGKVGSFSYRAWGDIMAAIWSEAEGKDYSYMDFYM